MKLMMGFALTFLFLLAMPFLIYAGISFYARPYQFNQIEALPDGRIGLILGTSKYLGKGRINLYYQKRMEAALALYRAGKVKYFIVSGDNRHHHYNEPEWMKADLIRGGVPEQNIQPDYAGLRTLDSILRADKIFGQKDYIIISQSFHNQRALFLSHRHGQKTLAFNADEPQISRKTQIKMLLRELGARSKALWDLMIRKQARHYGEPIVFPRHDS